jgi:hypothetical protein
VIVSVSAREDVVNAEPFDATPLQLQRLWAD